MQPWTEGGHWKANTACREDTGTGNVFTNGTRRVGIFNYFAYCQQF